MSNLVLPHGGKVLPLLASGSQWENGIKEAEATVCDTLVSNLDIPPTIVHLFGLDPVEKFEGHSLLPLADTNCV